MTGKAVAPESAINSYGYEITFVVLRAAVNRLRPPDRILTRKELAHAVINKDVSDGAIVQDNNGTIFTVRNRGSYMALLP